jgi:tetratricopeptide (TPR) repeat protein
LARPFRHTFILVLTAVATTLAAVGGWRFARASAPVNGPILLITIDSLRADHLPAYGYRNIRTPAIDALAADGSLFERAYSHAPQTLPAHTALLSGRLPFETGVRDDNIAVKPNDRLLPQLLRDRGYKTAGVVSSSLLGRATGIARGFDFFDEPSPKGRLQVDTTSRHRDGEESETIAERWLGTVGTSRAFLFLHLDEPRAQYTENSASRSASYDASIVRADEVVGHLIKYLKAHQLYDRSTIVLSSDHGEGLGDHGETGHGLFLYEEAVHVPLIIKQPAGVAAGVRIADLVQHIDVVPTVLDLVKAPRPGHLRGRTLAPIGDHASNRTVYAEALYGSRHFGFSPLAMITDGRYSYIQAPRDELFDLRSDPGQQTNLAEARIEQRQALAAALDREYRGHSGASPARRTADVDAPLLDAKDGLPIVETVRAAENLAAARKWTQAIRLLQSVIKEDPGIADVWNRLGAYARRIERYDLAADACARASEIDPSDVNAFLGGAAALLELRRLDEARERAVAALDAAGDRDARARSAGHELLARIALARHDAALIDDAREQAELARKADPARPLPAFIAARILFDQGKYDEAAPLFEEAVDTLARSHGDAIAELHFYAAATLARLDRLEEAKAQYAEELADFPQNTRASAALATLYHTTGATDEAERIVTEMIETTPTPDTYAVAARLLTAFGDSRAAALARAEARKALAETK